VDLNKLTTGDKIIAGGAILFLISMILPWYTASVKGVPGFGGGGSTSHNGFSYFLFGILPLILAIAMVVLIYLMRFQPNTNLPKPGPLTWSQVFLGAAGLSLLLVLLRLLLTDKFGTGGFVDSAVEFKRGIGLFLALIAAAAMTAGAFLKFQAKEDDAGAGPAASGPPTAF
jgi:hypothetical protein